MFQPLRRLLDLKFSINQPTIFHITHYKAGSQWVAFVLNACAQYRFVHPKTSVSHFYENPVKLGAIYPTICLDKPTFDAILGLNNEFDVVESLSLDRKVIETNCLNFRDLQKPYYKLVVIRDLRDALISAYFSIKISHPLLDQNLAKKREVLNSLDKEQGLIKLMESSPQTNAKIQLSWMNAQEALLVRYEDLLADEYGAFERIIDYCQIDISRQRLHQIIKDNSFEAVTGRKRGEENITVHQRKGIIGDWRNHFTDKVKENFKEKFGAVLIRTGYEIDYNW